MKRKRIQIATTGVALGMIITPMLDMSFQILAFFIMTYHPSAMEGHINGALVAKDPKGPRGEMREPTDPDPSPESNLQVIVKAVPRGGNQEHERVDGQPTQIYVKATEDVTPSLVADDGEAVDVSMRKLDARLKRAVAGSGLRGNVRLECQGDLKHQYVMRIYDVCKSAGYENVAFAAPARTGVAGDRKKD